MPPGLPVRADQSWFWTKRWQDREREIDSHVAAGRATVHDDGDTLLSHIGGLTDAS